MAKIPPLSQRQPHTYRLRKINIERRYNFPRTREANVTMPALRPRFSRCLNVRLTGSHDAGYQTGRTRVAANIVRSDPAAEGIRRRRCGRGFRYLGTDAAAIKDSQILTRIRSLVIPPAWEDV